ncbi:GP37 [Clanis bilineata nucleopolyhedrovirus]|uniref:GP37 n=1 Tax=Clanis bilineata nucleopolyhedrovirus TaxID=1307957 RepID=Q0N444_9ABAC|nr:GP37 [Clanis bilineata nucleopolyhedrovirus]ABF47399.1 GP37 [Clanis bilineata nucleopolyhedrovirus]
MTSLYFVVYCSLILIDQACAHGYMSWPAARQYKCYRDNNFWWPDTGENIPDEACREAYQSVYAKYRSQGESPGVAANAAQYMFQQYYEYAAVAGQQYDDIDHIKNTVVSSHLCAAGAAERWGVFGDKSGMDLPLSNWRPDRLYKMSSNGDNNKYNDSIITNIHFCPTTVHEPSYFEVFMSKPSYNYSSMLTWDDLQPVEILELDNDVYHYNKHSNLVANEGVDEFCTNTMIYVIRVRIPHRHDKFVLYVRWQRIDPVGEGFYNCADVIFDDHYWPESEKKNIHDEF